MKPGPKPELLSVRFLRHVRTPAHPDECIPWRGAIMDNGYGRLGRTTAHRAAYALFVADLPTDQYAYTVDHLCRNRACVNVLHLELVSQRENSLRGDRGRRMTHCHNGHEFTQENTLIENGRHRRCRTCKSEKQKRAARRFLDQARRACVECGTPVTRGAMRCLRCSAFAREAARRNCP